MDITSQIAQTAQTTPKGHISAADPIDATDVTFGRIPADTPVRTPCRTPHGTTVDLSDHAIDTSSDTLDGLVRELTAHSTGPRRLGVLGETYAAAWLEQLGWTIVERNWGTRFGELDLIALDPARTLVFVEVKTRRTQIFGPPQLAVGAHKQTNLRRAASLWLREPAHAIRRVGIRFDVVAIVVDTPRPHVQHIPGAF